MDSSMAQEDALQELTDILWGHPRTAIMVMIRLETQMTLRELAEFFGISRQAVSQAFHKLELDLLAAMPELSYHQRHGNRMRNPRLEQRKEFSTLGREAMTAIERRDAETIANRLVNAPKHIW